MNEVTFCVREAIAFIGTSGYCPQPLMSKDVNKFDSRFRSDTIPLAFSANARICSPIRYLASSGATLPNKSFSSSRSALAGLFESPQPAWSDMASVDSVFW